MSDEQPDPPAGAEAETPAPPAFSPGAALREARERLGLSIDEVAGRTKLAPRQIEALEADDFAHLPEAAFVRGFVRSYAKLLQIDAAPLLAALPNAAPPGVPLEAKVLPDAEFPTDQSVHKPNLVWLIAALVVAILLAVFAWLFERASDAPKTRVETVDVPVQSAAPLEAPEPASAPEASAPAASSVSAPQATPVSAPVAASAPVPASSKAPPAVSPNAPIRLAFDGESWVEITDKDGKVLLSKIGRAGDEDRVDGAPPFNVIVGYAAVVKLYYKGKPVDLVPHAHSEVARLTLE